MSFENINIVSVLDFYKFEILKEKIDKELENQFNKFGFQNHSFERWFMILVEEIAEISQEFISNKGNKLLNIEKELIQSITVLVQIWNGIYNKIDLIGAKLDEI